MQLYFFFIISRLTLRIKLLCAPLSAKGRLTLTWRSRPEKELCIKSLSQDERIENPHRTAVL